MKGVEFIVSGLYDIFHIRNLDSRLSDFSEKFGPRNVDAIIIVMFVCASRCFMSKWVLLSSCIQIVCCESSVLIVCTETLKLFRYV